MRHFLKRRTIGYCSLLRNHKMATSGFPNRWRGICARRFCVSFNPWYFYTSMSTEMRTKAVLTIGHVCLNKSGRNDVHPDTPTPILCCQRFGKTCGMTLIMENSVENRGSPSRTY